MNLFQVPIQFVERAWADGAHNLSQAVEKSQGEITADQLKLILTRGERILVGVAEEGQTPVGWAAVSVQQLPNLRTLYVYAIYAPGATGPEAFGLLKQYAKDNGCSEIRGACDDAVQRLWERKLGAQKVYTVMRIPV